MNQPNTKKHYAGFSLKQRLIPVLLLAFGISFTLCFFGPLDIYANNMAEFPFHILEFFAWNLLWSAVIAGLLIAILLPLRGRVFEIAYAIVLWLGLMLFFQGNYLNFGINSLAGDGLGTGLDVTRVIINCVIWLVVGAALVVAMILLKPERRDYLRLAGIIAMVTVIGVQLITFAITAIDRDIFNPVKVTDSDTRIEQSSEETGEDTESDKKQPATGSHDSSLKKLSAPDPITGKGTLTYKNFNRVSTEGNVIYFVIDRFDLEYMEKALNDKPELFDELDGFTFFDDMTSLYPRTYPSVPYMITGLENDFSLTRTDYLNTVYSSSDFLKTWKDNGYSINIYTDTYAGYDNAAYLNGLVDNAEEATDCYVNNSCLLSLDFVRLSLYRYLPMAAKNVVGSISTSHFNKYVTYVTNGDATYTTDLRDAYYYLADHPMETYSDTKNFTFIHVEGTHLPNEYDENFNPLNHDNDYDVISAMTQSFKIVNLYLTQLKELGLYEDATIIITGDHSNMAREENDPYFAYLTTLLVKESGSSEGELVRSSAPVCHDDLFATALKSEGLSTEEWGRTVFEIPEDEIRTRRYFYQRVGNLARTDYEWIEMEIVGPARDFNNWTIVDRYFLGKSVYD